MGTACAISPPWKTTSTWTPRSAYWAREWAWRATLLLADAGGRLVPWPLAGEILCRVPPGYPYLGGGGETDVRSACK